MKKKLLIALCAFGLLVSGQILAMKKLDEQLQDAVVFGRLEEVKRLLHKGANVNAISEGSDTLLHDAVDEIDVLGMDAKVVSEIVDALIKAGAKIEAKNNMKATPLHVAADLGTLASVKRLLEEGANINAQTKDKLTPLDLAKERWVEQEKPAFTREMKEEIIGYLIQKGGKSGKDL